MARVAFIVDQMFEDSEFRVPYDRVKEHGHEAIIVGVERGREIAGKKGQEKIQADVAIDEVSADAFDALVIPGGYSPDHLRTNRGMVGLTRNMFNADKPIAAICHAGSMLVEADIAEGRTLTSWPSVKTDLINAGARWVDQPLVEDGNLITSRKPDDLPEFCEALLRQIEEGIAPRLEPPLSPTAVSREAPERLH